MAQVIQDDNSIGSALGGSLGQGLGGALQLLAQNKLQHIMQKQQARQIAPGLAALGIPEEQAHQIAMLPENLQSVILKNYLEGAENSGLDQVLGQLAGEEVQPNNEMPRESLQENQPQQRKLSPFATPQDIFSSLVNPKAERKSEENPLSASQDETSKKTNNLQDILTRPRLSPEHKLKVAALQQQRQQHLEKLSAKEQEEVNKETKPEYDTIQKGYRAAKENNIRLNRMEELIKKGDLSNPLLAAGLDTLSRGIERLGVSIDLKAALTADSQEFVKLSADFIKNAKDFFGGRVTDQDLKAFLQTVPTLLQTDEGKLRVINNLRMFNDIALLRKKASDDIIKENGGRRPRNFDSLIDERTESQIDAIADKFKKGIEGPKKGIARRFVEQIPVVSHVGRLAGIL